MANNEYSVENKQCFVQISYVNLAKMTTFYNVPSDSSVSSLIAWMCDDFLGDVKLSKETQRRISEEIKRKKERREQRRREWAGSEESRKDAAKRKARRESGKEKSSENGGK